MTTKVPAMGIPTTADEWADYRRNRIQTVGEEAAFQAWLEADPRNANEYELAETLARFPKFLRNFPPDLASLAFSEALPPRSPEWRLTDKAAAKVGKDLGLTLLAGLTLAIVLAVLWYYLG